MLVGVILLFFGVSILPSITGNFEKNIKDGREIEVVNSYLDTETFYPTDDTSIKEYMPNTNYGSSYLVVRNKYGGGGNPGYEDDVLIKFDISEISADALITSATLKLYYYTWGQNNPSSRALTLYRIASDWDEDTVTWDTRPTYASEVTSSAIVPSYPGVWMEWNVTNDVQDFVNGQETNYGWQIMDEMYWGTYNIPATWFYPKEDGINTSYLEIKTIDELKIAFIIGKITNLDATGEFITCNAVNIRWIQFFPFSFIPCTSDEKITISKRYLGILNPNFVCGIFKAAI